MPSMHRRTFLHGSLKAALVGPFVAESLLAQAPVPQAPAGGRGAAPAPPAASAIRKLGLDANSRHLQWIRSADDLAQAAIEMVVGGVCISVGAYPAHVDAAKVTTDLPAF